MLDDTPRHPPIRTNALPRPCLDLEAGKAILVGVVRGSYPDVGSRFLLEKRRTHIYVAHARVGGGQWAGRCMSSRGVPRWDRCTAYGHPVSARPSNKRQPPVVYLSPSLTSLFYTIDHAQKIDQPTGNCVGPPQSTSTGAKGLSTAGYEGLRR